MRICCLYMHACHTPHFHPCQPEAWGVTSQKISLSLADRARECYRSCRKKDASAAPKNVWPAGNCVSSPLSEVGSIQACSAAAMSCGPQRAASKGRSASAAHRAEPGAVACRARARHGRAAAPAMPASLCVRTQPPLCGHWLAAAGTSAGHSRAWLPQRPTRAQPPPQAPLPPVVLQKARLLGA